MKSLPLLTLTLMSGCATHSIPPAERNEVHAQADAVTRNISAWCDGKITLTQSNHLLYQEGRWERGEITQQQYEREEQKILK